MLSLCLTSYNRSDMTIEAFSKVYDHELIDEIVIVDDCSEIEHYNKLVDLVWGHPAFKKIQLFRNSENLGMSMNKAQAISKAKNEWVIILDSDNILYPEYLEPIKTLFKSLMPNTIYCPIAAEPDHDFSSLPLNISKSNAKNLIQHKDFRVMINCCNYLVNRDQYLSVYKYDETIKESDTIHFNYLWLAAGYGFMIVPGMKYFHRKHSESGWLKGDHKYNLQKATEIQEKIKQL